MEKQKTFIKSVIGAFLVTAAFGLSSYGIAAGPTSSDFITEQETSQTLSSSIVGMSVQDGPGDDAKEVGKVTDLILDDDNELTGVVVGVGGFLGMGQKDVAIPWQELQGVNTDQHVAYIAMSKDDLKAAPAFLTADEKHKQQEQELRQMRTQPDSGAAAGGAAGMGSAPATPAR